MRDTMRFQAWYENKYGVKYKKHFAALAHEQLEAWQAAQADALAKLANLKAQVLEQAETIEGWVRPNEVSVSVDTDKIQAWVEILKDISAGAADKTELDRVQKDLLDMINEYNECVGELNDARALVGELIGYAGHDEDCAVNKYAQYQSCSCGYTKALTKAQAFMEDVCKS